MKIVKKDVLFIVVLFVLAIFILFINNSRSKNGNYVKILVDGKVYAKYSLESDNIYKIETDYGYNVIKIKDGKVSITEASCKNKICVNHNKISMDNESIICIPNKLVVTIVSETKNKIDDIAH